MQEFSPVQSNPGQQDFLFNLPLYRQRISEFVLDPNPLLPSATFRLLFSNVYYRSDVYTHRGAGYYPIVVWQFWGRAAEAS